MTQHLTRTVGLSAAIFVIVGYVIGASIFILPGKLAAQVGPGTYIVYLLAGIPAIFTCLVMAQIGSCYPRSGAIFVLFEEVFSPVISFLYVWIMMLLAGVVIPLVAYGFADYIGHFILLEDKRTTALVIIVAFTIINITNLKLVTRAQAIMSLIFIAALLIFGLGGVFHAQPSTASTLFPNGLSIVGVSVVTAYFSYTGFFVIVEIAGEIKNPTKVIPQAILISFIIIIFAYALIPYALTSVLDWRSLADTDIPVVTAAKSFLSAPFVSFLALGALMAAATSINGILMGISRDIYKSSKSKVFIDYFGAVNTKTQTPVRAVILTGGCAITGAFIGNSVVGFAQLTVMGLVLIQIATGLALLQVPSKFPELYNALEFKLSPWLLKTACYGYIVFSLVFLFFLSIDDPTSVAKGSLFLIAGYVFFVLKRRPKVT